MAVLIAYQQSTPTSLQLPREWTAPQFEELQLLALSCLNQFLPRMLPAFAEGRGVSVLLSALSWALDERPVVDLEASVSDQRLFRGAGNAFHATGGFGQRGEVSGSSADFHFGCCA